MSDVYKVGVAIALSSNATQIFGALGQHFLKLDKHLMNFQNNWKKTALLVGGGLGVFGGITVLKGAEKLIDHGNDLVKIQRDMAQAGVSSTQIQEAYAKAWQMTAKYQNMSAVEVLKMQNDARMTFGDQGQATHHIDDFVQMASFLKAYEGGEHSSHSEGLLREVNAAMKSGELAGKINPEEMAEHVKQLTAMKIAYGEQLKIGQYLTAQRAAGVALRNSSDAFRYGMFPALVQENGPGAGVMLMTAFNKIVAGTGNRTKSLEHMADIGLLHKDQLDYDKVGRIKGLKDPSAILNNHDAAVNFGDWVMKTFKPLIDAKTEDPIRQAQMISAMFPDRNAAKAITEIIQQYRKLAKDAEQMAKARAAMDTTGYNAGSWDYQKEAFQTQWTNLMDALGAPLVKTATENLKKINEQMAGFSQWAGKPENADTVRRIGEGIIILGGALLGAGAVAIIAALGPAGWLVLGIGALAAACVMLNVQWSTFTSAFGRLREVLSGPWVAILSAIPSPISAALAALRGLNSISWSGLVSMFNGISSAISGFIDAIKALYDRVTGFFIAPSAPNAPSKSFKENLDDANKNYVPMRFAPGQAAPAAKPLTISLNIDGRTLAQAVADQLTSLYGYDTSTPAFNGANSYRA